MKNAITGDTILKMHSLSFFLSFLSFLLNISPKSASAFPSMLH